MSEIPYNVLFLGTRNSARSILAEALLNSIGEGRFKAYSAGSTPAGALHAHVVPLVGMLGFPAESFRPKSWQEFTRADAPQMDFIFTLCDEAAGETSPEWPGQPVTSHWGVPDPAKVTHSEAETAVAFDDTARQLRRRLELFTTLPLVSIDRMAMHHHLTAIHGEAEQSVD